MENASKALIIAGSILLAVALISLGVYLFNQGRQTAINAMTNLPSAPVIDPLETRD